MRAAADGSAITELIDTLWNVNASNAAISALISWINRYIMECKFLALSGHVIAVIEN